MERDPDSDSESAKHVCGTCGKVLAHQSSKSRHEKSCKKKHNIVTTKVQKSYVCSNSWCGKIFKKVSNFNRHMLICKRKQTKVYVCNKCDKSFDKHSKLLRHELIHTKEAYTCDRCFASYKIASRFQAHQERCQESSSTVTSALLDMPTMAVADDDVTIASIPPAAAAFEVVGEPECDVDKQLQEHDINISINNVECISPLESELGCDVSSYVNIDQPCSSSFVDLFQERSTIHDHTKQHNSTTEETPTEETPSVYIVDDEDAFEYEAFDNMDFLYADTPPIYSKQQLHSEVGECTVKHLKMLKHQSKRSSVKQREFATLCILLYKQKIDDLVFMDALAAELGFVSRQELLDLINTDTPKLAGRGRPMRGTAERQLAYDFWKQNSDISNDRRNARHMCKVKPSKRDCAIQDLVDDTVKECRTKSGLKLKAQKYIYNGTIRELYKKFKSINPDTAISSSLFFRCRPFYVSPATAREMESCMCSKCLNPHSLYSTLRRNMDDLPQSMSEYLTMYFECQEDSRLNYPKLECIHGTCKNNCQIADETHEDKHKELWEKKVSYYQFQTVKETYCNREGEEKFYTRTARKDFKDVPLKQVYEKFQLCARSYLVHRYHTLLDKVYWQQYIDETDGAIVWMDYSQNIKLTEKKQSQSAHFSGKQQTLHDSLILHDNAYHYVYHISDDTNHDSVMTLKIVEDIIVNHPEVIKTGILNLRSDNCSSQYKCRFVFKGLLDLAKKYNVRINFFYGEAGHGRGLIDAMAWFGAKGPMRKCIIDTDKWFENAEQMVSYLNELKNIKNDKSKEYHYLDQYTTAALRREGRSERRIVGSSFAHVISFFSDVHTFKKWLTIKDFMDDMNSNNIPEPEHEEEQFEEQLETVEEIEELPTWHETMDEMDMFKLIEVNSFVAIRSERGELFHLMKVEKKKTAEKSFMDASGKHSILEGEPYLVCKWYSFQKETKKFAWFSPQSEKTMESNVHIGEIFSTDLTLNDKNQMDINEYRMLVCNAT